MRTIIYSLLLLNILWAQDSLQVGSEQENEAAALKDSITVEPGAIEVNEILTQEIIPHGEPALVILPFYQGTTSIKKLNVESIIRTEILNNQLMDLAVSPEHTSLYGDDRKLCLADSCLEQYAAVTQSSQAFIWKPMAVDNAYKLSISLIELSAPYLKTKRELAIHGLRGDQKDLEIEIRRTVWDLLGKTPPPGYFEDTKEQAWHHWITDAPNRYYASGAGAVLLVWILMQGDDTAPEDGIGLPPDWPEN